MYEPAVCGGRRGDLESLESRGASLWSGMTILSGSVCGRRRKPRNGTLGVFWFEGSGDCEYIEEPLTMERTLKCSPPNRGEDVVAGDSAGPNVGVWSGRGERPNAGVEGI